MLDVFKVVNPNNFPFLWEVVLKMMSVMPTSASCEQSFSRLRNKMHENMMMETSFLFRAVTRKNPIHFFRELTGIETMNKSEGKQLFDDNWGKDLNFGTTRGCTNARLTSRRREQAAARSPAASPVRPRQRKASPRPGVVGVIQLFPSSFVEKTEQVLIVSGCEHGR